jgi:hypothetical protein
MNHSRTLRHLALATLIVAGTVAAAPAAAQPAQPPLSPPAQATGTIDGDVVTIDYSSPRVRGRKIMGELVPYGKVWRTGANAATTLTTVHPLTIGDLQVPAGKHTLFTIPGETEWTLIVNKQTGQWGTNYDESQDLGRVPMTVSTLAEAREEMTIAIREDDTGRKMLVIEWENTAASVPIATVTP